MAQYTHLKERFPGEQYLDGLTEDFELYETLIDYKGKKIIAVQKEIVSTVCGDNLPIILVPGFVENYKYEHKNGVYFSEISEIPKKLHKEITKTIHKEGLEGRVNYW
ncbi:hypothetical protein ISS04_02720 [Candidatus Woesearchaeota archaeon]|nr:hypothetical protein [Candidatus Woesearchaeota archaeon]